MRKGSERKRVFLGDTGSVPWFSRYFAISKHGGIVNRVACFYALGIYPLGSARATEFDIHDVSSKCRRTIFNYPPRLQYDRAAAVLFLSTSRYIKATASSILCRSTTLILSLRLLSLSLFIIIKTRSKSINQKSCFFFFYF